jgi:hypothetical protein
MVSAGWHTNKSSFEKTTILSGESSFVLINKNPGTEYASITATVERVTKKILIMNSKNKYGHIITLFLFYFNTP